MIEGVPPRRDPRSGDSVIVISLGGMAGAIIGIVSALLSMLRLPVPSGPNAMAGAMIGETIQLLAVVSFIAGGMFGIIGAQLRPTRLSIPLSIILAVLAAAFCGSTDPLVGRMAPYLLGGAAVAVLAGAGIQSRMEKR